MQFIKRLKTIRDCSIKEKKALKNNDPRKKFMHLDMLSLFGPLISNTNIADYDEKVDDADRDITTQGRKNEEGKTAETFAIVEKKKEAEPRIENETSAKHFMLSLLDDFKSIPKNLKMDAKFEILSILKKYTKSEANDSDTLHIIDSDNINEPTIPKKLSDGFFYEDAFNV